MILIFILILFCILLYKYIFRNISNEIDVGISSIQYDRSCLQGYIHTIGALIEQNKSFLLASIACFHISIIQYNPISITIFRYPLLFGYYYNSMKCLEIIFRVKRGV